MSIVVLGQISYRIIRLYIYIILELVLLFKYSVNTYYVLQLCLDVF